MDERKIPSLTISPPSAAESLFLGLAATPSQEALDGGSASFFQKVQGVLRAGSVSSGLSKANTDDFVSCAENVSDLDSIDSETITNTDLNRFSDCNEVLEPSQYHRASPTNDAIAPTAPSSSRFSMETIDDDKSIESASTTSSNSKKKSKMPAGKLNKKKAAAVAKTKPKPAPPVVETEVEKPQVAVEPQVAHADPVPEVEDEKEKPMKVDAAEIVYGKAKEILLWGKSVPVVSFLVGTSEHVAGKALGVVGTDLAEVDGKIETELTKFDTGVLNPAIEAVAKILIGVAGKSEEALKPIIEMLMVPIGKLIKSKADEATPEAHTENPEVTK